MTSPADRTPLLDEVLRARFAVLDSGQVEDLCAYPSLAEAMVALISLLLDGTGHVLWESDRCEVGHLVWCLDSAPVPIGGRGAHRRGRVGEITVIDQHHWASAPAGQERARRFPLLAEHLTRAMTLGGTVDGLVRLEHRRNVLWWVDLRAGVTLWWEARMAEGHTPASARTLLALIADPLVLRQFSFDSPAAPRLLTCPWSLTGPC